MKALHFSSISLYGLVAGIGGHTSAVYCDGSWTSHCCGSHVTAVPGIGQAKWRYHDAPLCCLPLQCVLFPYCCMPLSIATLDWFTSPVCASFGSTRCPVLGYNVMVKQQWRHDRPNVETPNGTHAPYREQGALWHVLSAMCALRIRSHSVYQYKFNSLSLRH